MPEPRFRLPPEDERRLAAGLFNHVWTLLERPSRTVDEDDEMLHAAHASRHHWGEAGELVHRARAEWQCARVYAVLGRAEPALHHARRSLALCEHGPVEEFDLPFAHEALARAYLVAVDREAARRHLERARALSAGVADEEDRAIVTADLDDLAARLRD